jgi:hypothetical protein
MVDEMSRKPQSRCSLSAISYQRRHTNMTVVHLDSNVGPSKAYEAKILEMISTGRAATGEYEFASAVRIAIWS